MASFRRRYDRALEIVAVIMIVAVTLIVCVGFISRELGIPVVWYDEIASIALAWLTYYGSALAALRGGHIGFAGFVNSLPSQWRVAATLLASAITVGFFVLLAITGYQVMSVIAGLTLVSVPEVQQSWAASVIPITSVLFVIAELVRLPELVEEARRGPLVDHEIKDALEHGRIAARDGERTP